MAASRTLLCALLAAACLSAAMASTENAVARKLASHRQLNGFKPIPIDASVILLFLSDVEGGDNSPCVAMVNRAMEFKGRAINFFVTAYYADDNSDSRVDRLGWKKSEQDKSFRDMDLNYVAAYQKGLQVSNNSRSSSARTGSTGSTSCTAAGRVGGPASDRQRLHQHTAAPWQPCASMRTGSSTTQPRPPPLSHPADATPPACLPPSLYNPIRRSLCLSLPPAVLHAQGS
jgi:opacity protein-like surface antigen